MQTKPWPDPKYDSKPEFEQRRFTINGDILPTSREIKVKLITDNILISKEIENPSTEKKQALKEKNEPALDSVIVNPTLINNVPIKSGYPHPMAILSSCYATEESSYRIASKRAISARQDKSDSPGVQAFSRYNSLRPGKHRRSSHGSYTLKDPPTPSSESIQSGNMKSITSINASLS